MRRRTRSLLLSFACTAAVLATAVAGLGIALAQEQPPERTVTGVEPATIRQGDTVMLTITGENLPTGTVVVEFFPQHIALLDVLAASATEVLAQVKVPNLAPPGAYNILVYNHLGEEAFGSALLTVSSHVITPVFYDYDPKVIGEASEGFALLLLGEAIAPDVADHLSMRWRQGERELDQMETTFSKGGPGQLVCAVTGELPRGTIQGRVFLDDKPIYQVEIVIEGAAGMIVGHGPGRLPASVAPYEVRLLGTDFSARFLDSLTVELSSAETTARPREISLVDGASVQVVFSGPLPVGQYELSVSRGQEQVYRGEVVLTEDELVAEVAGGQAEPAEAATVPPPLDVPPPESVVEASPAAAEEGPAVVPSPPVTIEGVAPTELHAGERPASLVVTGAGLAAEMVERLLVELTARGEQCSLLFLGAGPGRFTCLFAPPKQGWLAGDKPRLRIVDPLGQVPDFAAELTVTAEMPAAAAVPVPGPEPAALVPSVDNAYVRRGVAGSTLVITLAALRADWDPALLTGFFSLVPRDPRLGEAFSNLTLAGDLVFRRSESGIPLSTFAGSFVPGDLLVRVSYGGGAPVLNSLALEAPDPEAELIAPDAEYVLRDAASGSLQPASLRWVIEFAPLVVADPSFLHLSCTPAPADAGAGLALRADGTKVIVSQDLSYWQGMEETVEELTLRVDSDVAIDWRGAPQHAVPVRNFEEPYAGLSISIADSACDLSADGLAFVLFIDGPAPPVAELTKVVLQTEHLLLERSLENFRTLATTTSVAEGPAVRLEFRRDREALADLAYDLLLEELLESESIPLTLSWPALGISTPAEVAFRRAPEAGAGDLLEELGLGPATE